MRKMFKWTAFESQTTWRKLDNTWKDENCQHVKMILNQHSCRGTDRASHVYTHLINTRSLAKTENTRCVWLCLIYGSKRITSDGSIFPRNETGRGDREVQVSSSDRKLTLSTKIQLRQIRRVSPPVCVAELLCDLRFVVKNEQILSFLHASLQYSWGPDGSAIAFIITLL